MSKKKKLTKKERALIIIAGVVLIFLIIAYFVSLGKVNYLSETDENKKKLKWIEDKLKDLESDVVSKQDLKRKLDERVRVYFFRTRLAIIVVILLLNWWWYYLFGKVSIHSFSFCRPIDREGITGTISVILDFNQFLFLILLVFLFLKFETLKEIKDIVKILHLYVRRIVYRKHKGLEKEIQEISLEIEKLNKEKEEIKNKLDKPD